MPMNNPETIARTSPTILNEGGKSVGENAAAVAVAESVAADAVAVAVAVSLIRAIL